MTHVPALLRAAVLALLAAAVVLFPRISGEGRTSPGTAVVRLEGPLRPGPVLDSLLVAPAPPLVARLSTEPPSAAELERLTAVAARAPLAAALPDGLASLSADAPARPVATRAAAVSFRIAGAPGDTVVVRLADAAGELDTVAVALDSVGRGSGAFRVRPPRRGWREWVVSTGEGEAWTGAWVDSAGPPRLLVRTGLPGWESRFAIRALEESGAAVDVVSPLGRGLSVGDADAAGRPSMRDPSGLAGYDAVLVLDGAAVDDAELRALAGFASAGGGVLLAGDRVGGPFGVGRAGEGRTILGSDVAWTLPAELAALPAARVRVFTQPIAGAGPGARAGASLGGAPMVVLRPLGRGRVAAVGLAETWRWRMEAGAVDAHREFWRSLADWLAAAPRARFVADVADPLPPVGAAVRVRLFASSEALREASAGPDAGDAPVLVVTRPDGARDTLSLTPDPERPGVLSGQAVPAAPGLHLLSIGDAPPSAAFRALPADSARAPTPWARLALLAAESGGIAAGGDEVEAEVARRAAAGEGEGGGWDWAWLILVGTVLLAGTEWGVRRWRGMR